MPPIKSSQPKIDQFLREANREEVGEERGPGGQVPCRGVRSGGGRGRGGRGRRVLGGRVRGGRVRGGRVRGGRVPGGRVRGGRVRGAGVPGGRVPGGGSEENPDATQEETAGGERTFNLPDTPCVNPDTPCVNPGTPCVNPDTPCVNPGTPCVNPDTPSVNPGTPSVNPGMPRVKQEEMAEEQHGHTISWDYGKEKKYSFYCNKAGTIYESLQRSDQFQETEQKSASGDPKKKKELVILISVKTAISSHFPCSHIPTENLSIKFINAKDNQTTMESIKIENPGEFILFSIKTSGTTNIIKLVMKNPELKKIVDEVLVYGYKGQTVREALKQDGRFNEEVLQSNYLLVDTKDGKLTEMSSPVDVLHDKGFWVKRIRKNGTKQEAASSRTASPKGNQPTPNQSNQPNPNQSNQPTPNQSNQPTSNKSSQLSIYQPIPNSEDLLQLLRSQYKDLVKKMKERQNLGPRAVEKLLSQEFGKSTEFCHEVRAMRRFLELGDSVCQVRIDDSAEGSGFLLYGKYILTNAHVVCDEATKEKRENITVIFAYEKLADSQSMGVEVVAGVSNVDDEGHKHDWALLEVSGDLKNGPIKAKPLLEHLGPVTERGQICIIGHPAGAVKMMDPCFTIPLSEREQIMMFLTSKYTAPKVMDEKIHTYKSCFYFGSSGSPVFDINFKVVSMHSGGFPDEKKVHLLEYSQPLSIIIEEILIQILRDRKVDLLLAMATCVIPPMVEDVLKKILSNDKGLVWTEEEMINLCEGDQAETNAERLKVFFRLNSQRDEPMDTK